MMKLCLYILFLNTIFSAQEESPAQKFKRERMELFAVSSKKINRSYKNSAPDTHIDYGIYGQVWNACENISQALGRNYKYRLENPDFEWQEKIDKNFFRIFFKVSTDHNLAKTLTELATVVDLEDQQKIVRFLCCFDSYKTIWTTHLINYQEIRNFFNTCRTIKEIALDGVENIYRKISYRI